MHIDRASPDDLMVLASERGAVVPMQLGVLLELEEGSAVVAGEVLGLLAPRVDAVPRLRQRLRGTPPGCGRPVWVDDPGFALDHHLDVQVLAQAQDDRSGAGGAGASALKALAALVLDRLPRDRPLWRARVLVDANGAVVAVAVVLHHVLADGVGGLAVLAALLDGSPVPEGDVAAGEATGAPHPARPPTASANSRDLAHDAWSERRRTVAALPALFRRLRGGATELGLGRPYWLGRTSLLAPTGPDRRIDVVEVHLAAVVEAAGRDGATVNDEVLVAVGDAIGRLLASRDEQLDELVVSVPVSGRAPGREGELGNVVGVLPVTITLHDDRRASLAAVRVQRSRLGAGPARGSSSQLLSSVFRALASVGLFQVFIRHQRWVHTFETNVRGPAGPLFLGGARVKRVVPVAVNPGNVTVSFDVLSAVDRLVISIVCDPDRVPDHEVLRSALQDELDTMSSLGSLHGNGAAPAG